jgi:hypothetical protein
VTPSDDLFPPRRPIFFPVVIATVFLTIIGGTVGFMLGERHRGGGGGATPGATNAGADPSSSVDDLSSAEPSGSRCPDEAIQAAASLQLPTDLRQIFKIVTTNGTTVWICQDGANSLYFQSKTGGVDAPLVQGRNGLFLAQVSRVGDDEYLAIAPTDGNQFEVNRRHLVVHFASGKRDEVYTVKTVE